MKVIMKGNTGYYCFECPGCGSIHLIPTNGAHKTSWGFNNNVYKPTFTPSLKVTWGPIGNIEKHICHSFITDGRIQFLSDCTHDQKGQTIELPKLDESFIEYYGE